MKAIRLVEIGQPLELHDVPDPQIKRSDVLVRVRAAGICHSDAHYRAGASPVGALPQTLGHEVAGTVEEVGAEVKHVQPGDRVALHYLLACGDCAYCRMGSEQFCVEGAMIGKHTDGGFAEYIAVPARNLVPLPEGVSFAQGAAMMCSTATSYHALRKARFAAGETVAVFGAGGLGISAIQLATALGARTVYAVDISPAKLKLAAELGAVTVDAAADDPVEAIRAHTAGRGVDVALELIGLPTTMRQAVRSLAVFGRAGLAGISARPFEVDSYGELLGREAEVIGCADHLMHEFPQLMDLAQRGLLRLDPYIESVPLDADAVNRVLDDLGAFGAPVRTVIAPGG
jgi:D-arabinose 1-dehydrogenase-like Zn-dependent alcohol dehydrogenase